MLILCCVGLVLVSVEGRLNGLGGFAVGPMVVYETELQLQWRYVLLPRSDCHELLGAELEEKSQAHHCG